MTEIEKLYKNAGVKPIHYDACKIADAYWVNEELANEYGTFDNYMKLNCPYKYEECTDNCRHAFDRDTYPPFTAEKQLELIKLLGNVRDYTVEIDKFKGVYYAGCRSAGSNDKLWGSGNMFEDALAELINETWFCLTEEEKQQIKEILQ